MSDEDDYRLQHKSPGPGDGAPMHDIEPVMPEVHEHPEYYRHGDVGYDESLRHIRRVRGNPEARVTIYRSLPAEHVHKGFQTGDWVSPSKEYARRHGIQQNERGHDDWPVIHTTVPAKHLFNEGDATEFGYHGPSTESAEVAFKGGKNQEVRQHADGVVRKVVRRDGPVKDYSFSSEDHRDNDERESGVAPHGVVHAWAPQGQGAGHIKFGPEGHEVHIEPEHQHVADELERRMRRKIPKESSVQRVAVLHGFAQRSDEDADSFTRRTASSGPKITVVAHVSGNSIDLMHCPFCGSGALVARSDGTTECQFCTSVFTVQVQPQFAAFPQTAEGTPYQWPGQPGPEQLAGGGSGAMGGFPGPVAGEQDPEAEGGDGNPFADDADESGAGSDDGSDGPDDDGGKAQVGGKDAPPFGKKSSSLYRTAAGHLLDETRYLQHLAISHAHNRGVVAQAIRAAR